MKKIIVVTGQTATGKTKYANTLAIKLKGELVNCDSRQVYKFLDILTGKEKSKITVKTWLYDMVDPKSHFSSFEYQKIAGKVVEDIINRSKTPIIVGGAYLYLKHLLYGINHATEADWIQRRRLEQKSVLWLQKKLKQLSSPVFEKLTGSDKKNPRRLIRAIEKMQKTGRQNGTNQKIYGLAKKFAIDIVGFRFKNIERLRAAIEKRVFEHLRAGALVEVEQILKMDYTEDDPGLQTIGCKQLLNYLKGKITKEEAIREWITKEVQYAKRQYIFMKQDKNINWIDV